MKIQLLGVAIGVAATLAPLSPVAGAAAQAGRIPTSPALTSLWSRVWAMPGHDSLRTGRTPVIGPHTPFLRWSAPLPSSTSNQVSDPVVSLSGTVYLLVRRDDIDPSALIAVAPNGIVRYLTNQDLGVRGQPAIGIDGNVYVWSALGLTAISPLGQVRWSFSGGRSDATVGPDGRVYVHGTSGVHVLSPNGTESHFIPTFEGQYFLVSKESMSVGLDGAIYFGTQAGWFAFSPTGSLRYRHQEYGRFDAPYELPAIAADGSSYYGPAALAADGTVRAFPGLNGAPVLGADGTVYVIRRDVLVPGCVGKTGIVAHNPNGTLKWCHSTRSPVGSLAIDGEGTIYYNAIGAVGAVSPDGTQRWELAVPDLEEFGFYSARTLAIGPDGSLYIRGLDRLVVID